MNLGYLLLINKQSTSLGDNQKTNNKIVWRFRVRLKHEIASSNIVKAHDIHYRS